MKFRPPHLLIGDTLHCPVHRVAHRVVSLSHDSHRYDCPSCGANLRLKNHPITRELEEVPRRKDPA